MNRKQLTPLGTFNRPRRETMSMSLGEMADHIGVSSARLSTAELHDPIFPKTWIEPFSAALKLNGPEEAQLRAIYDQIILGKLANESPEFSELMTEINEIKERIPPEGFIKLKQLARSLAGLPPSGQDFEDVAIP